ncbi:MAG: type II secretion system protein [Sulfurospirillaceae bacterium]|nr:type II secretion system protein [Sulfurospirillaceae bacterium]
MVELIFVIVVLGILAAVAIPKLAVTRDDAEFVKAKSEISAIRSGLSLLKSKRMMEGNTTMPQELDTAAANTAPANLFSGGGNGNVLEYPIIARATGWMKTSANTADPITYSITLSSGAVTFNYSKTNGTFDCNHTDAKCNDLTR